MAEKLPLITGAGDWVGELLIGLDSLTTPIPTADVAELVARGGLSAGGWRGEYREWAYSPDGAYRIRVWLWYRIAGSAPHL